MNQWGEACTTNTAAQYRLRLLKAVVLPSPSIYGVCSLKRIAILTLGLAIGWILAEAAKADVLTDAINVERAKHGLSALAHEPALTLWAESNNAQQRARGMGHFVLGPCIRQNVAWGQRDIASVVYAWMCSPGHRAAILQPDATYCGGAFDGSYWTWSCSSQTAHHTVTQQTSLEAKPAASAPKPPPPDAVVSSGKCSAAACPTAPPCIFTERVPIRRVGRAFSFRRWLIGGCK